MFAHEHRSGGMRLLIGLAVLVHGDPCMTGWICCGPVIAAGLCLLGVLADFGSLPPLLGRCTAARLRSHAGLAHPDVAGRPAMVGAENGEPRRPRPDDRREVAVPGRPLKPVILVILAGGLKHNSGSRDQSAAAAIGIDGPVPPVFRLPRSPAQARSCAIRGRAGLSIFGFLAT